MLLLSGCVSNRTKPYIPERPTAEQVTHAFSEIKSTPYDSDPFSRHAYISGYISAFSLGRGSLGALLTIPTEYNQKNTEIAYREGWKDGGMLAFRVMPIMREPKK